MLKNQGQVKIYQRIDYDISNDVDEFQHETSATCISLTTYSRLTYNDQENRTITIKWQKNSMDNQYLVEIRQPQVTLNFCLNRLFQVNYPTPQGIWPLKIDTKQLQIEESDSDELKMTIKYKMYLDNEFIGNYHFRLIYQANISNI